MGVIDIPILTQLKSCECNQEARGQRTYTATIAMEFLYLLQECCASSDASSLTVSLSEIHFEATRKSI